MEIKIGDVSLGNLRHILGRWHWESCWQVKGEATSRPEACHALLEVYAVIQGAALLRGKAHSEPVTAAIDKWNLHYQRLALTEGYRRDGLAWHRYEEDRIARAD